MAAIFLHDVTGDRLAGIENLQEFAAGSQRSGEPAENVLLFLAREELQQRMRDNEIVLSPDVQVRDIADGRFQLQAPLLREFLA